MSDELGDGEMEEATVQTANPMDVVDKLKALDYENEFCKHM